MSTPLSPGAVETIEAAGLTIAHYTSAQGWLRPGWWGDSCGCTDDRCIGHHHDPDEPCLCIHALIGYALSTRNASEGGR